jgi:hypothetical protein
MNHAPEADHPSPTATTVLFQLSHEEIGRARQDGGSVMTVQMYPVTPKQRVERLG